MIYLYKKVDKTKNNTYGFTEVRKVKELNRPFLLCLSGNDKYDKSVFGIMRAGVQAARGYTTREMAAGFALNAMPIDFLGIRFNKDEKYKNNYEEIAERFLFPFLVRDKEFKKVRKQARMINILAYDKGALEYRNIEITLKNLLVKAGYSKEEVIEILTQICVVALGTNADLDEVRATCTIFNDVNDIQVAHALGDKYRRVLERNNARIMFLPNGDYDCLYFSFLGTGEHSLKAYFSDSCVAKPSICAIISNALENSLINTSRVNLYKMNLDTTLKVVSYYASDNCPVEMTLGILDSRISYCNAYRYSIPEASLRKQLDDTYKLLRKSRINLKKENSEEELRNIKFNTLIKNIRKYCSDTTYYQILIESGLWKGSKEILDEESDRVIRKKYDKLPKSVREEKKKTATKKTATKKKTTKTNTAKKTSEK